jgi:hypothetical protein
VRTIYGVVVASTARPENTALPSASEGAETGFTRRPNFWPPTWCITCRVVVSHHNTFVILSQAVWWSGRQQLVAQRQSRDWRTARRSRARACARCSDIAVVPRGKYIMRISLRRVPQRAPGFERCGGGSCQQKATTRLPNRGCPFTSRTMTAGWSLLSSGTVKSMCSGACPVTTSSCSQAKVQCLRP